QFHWRRSIYTKLAKCPARNSTTCIPHPLKKMRQRTQPSQQPILIPFPENPFAPGRILQVTLWGKSLLQELPASRSLSRCHPMLCLLRECSDPDRFWQGVLRCFGTDFRESGCCQSWVQCPVPFFSSARRAR